MARVAKDNQAIRVAKDNQAIRVIHNSSSSSNLVGTPQVTLHRKLVTTLLIRNSKDQTGNRLLCRVSGAHQGKEAHRSKGKVAHRSKGKEALHSNKALTQAAMGSTLRDLVNQDNLVNQDSSSIHHSTHRDKEANLGKDIRRDRVSQDRNRHLLSNRHPGVRRRSWILGNTQASVLMATN
jgi:hypothetical protein